MDERFCSLIVIGPGSPRTFKLHLSRSTAKTLGLVLLLCFLIMVTLGYTFPSPISESHRAELEAENRALRAEAVEAANGIKKLDAKLLELEEKSKHIHELAAQ
jgi:Tfp pilus assembly protein PilO